jgi:hypothetical protein
VFKQLYERGKQQRLARKEDKDKDVLEYEKHSEECTFMPKPIATKNLKFMGKNAPSQISPRYNEMWKKAGTSVSNISDAGSSAKPYPSKNTYLTQKTEPV